MFKLDLEKTEEPEIKLPTSIGSQEKQENSRKTSASLTTLKPLCESQHLQNFERDGNTRPPYLPPEKPVCRSRSKLEHTEQQTGKVVHQGCILSPCLFNLQSE